MAIPTNDRLPDEIENVLKEYEGLVEADTGSDSLQSELDINTYVSEVMFEIQQMRENESSRNA